MARLRIATFNINGVRAREGALLEWLAQEKPDIACLQELKAPDEAFPLAAIEALGYGAIWHGQKSWNGVAILARGAQPVERRRGLPGDADDAQSRYLEASVHGLVVGCLYLPNGNPWPGPKFDYKLAWFERLRRHAKALLSVGEPTVLAGDFNVVPTDELDIYNPKSWRKDALLQPESREAWFRLLEQGWTDALRTVVGDAKVFTFWDYFRQHWERDAGLRIDHLLLDPTLAPMLADAGVDRWVRGRPGASDHAPTWVLLETGGRRSAAGRGAANTRTAEAPAARGARRGARAAATTRAAERSGASDPAGGRVAAARAKKTGSAAPAKKASKRASGVEGGRDRTPRGSHPVKKTPSATRTRKRPG